MTITAPIEEHPLASRTLHVVATQRKIEDHYILEGHQVFDDQAVSFGAFQKAAATHPEKMHQNFSITMLNLADHEAIDAYIAELIEEGLEGAPAAEHNAPGSNRYRISGPEVTGFESEYLVHDTLYHRVFGHSSDERIEPGHYDNLPTDFADSEW